MKDYHINIFYSDEDGGYIADIPDLKACQRLALHPKKPCAIRVGEECLAGGCALKVNQYPSRSIAH